MKKSRICNRCGAIVIGKCDACYTPAPRGTTAERGYDHQWRKLSEYKRALDPMCEMCLRKGKAAPARHVHHIEPIAIAPHRRLEFDNLMSVCVECHEELHDSGG